MNQYPLITIVGGSGFLGRHLIKQLARSGYRIRVLSRDAVKAEFVKTAGTVGQIVTQYADITKPETLAGKFDGSWAVINLVSILYERGRQKFHAVNLHGAAAVADAARAAGAARFIQISALGVERAADSKYASTKKAGEDAVRAAFPGATILRPGLLVGAEDRFFQRFARLSLLLPALPLIGGGKSLFQPTLVTDVAAAIAAALADASSIGQTYELAGPEAYSFKEWMERLRGMINRRFCLVNLPVGLASFMGRLASLSPFPPLLTADQVKLLGHDNVMNSGAAGYAALGMQPHLVSAALPAMLTRYVKE